MILWISIAITIISAIVSIISFNKFSDFWDFCDVIGTISSVLFVLFFIISAVLGVIAVSASVGSESYLASMQEKRNALVYQLENDLYDNDNDLGKKELYSEIAEYNCDVAKGKIMQDNIWVYNLYADVYDDLELIKFDGKEP